MMWDKEREGAPMKLYIKRKITTFALMATMIFGVLGSSNVISYAASTATTTTADITKIEALKTYKGNTTEFNAYDYYINNADLQTAIGPDGDALLKHYKEYGKKEGRIAIVATPATTTTSSSGSKATTKSTGATSGGFGFDTYDIPEQQNTEATYVLNTKTKKFHKPSCNDVKKIKPANYSTSSASRDDIIAQGYSSCGHCHP